MNIQYRTNHAISVDQFKTLLHDSTLGERRPIDDIDCLQGMLEHANLTMSAWDDDLLIGIARCITDFHYACYLSDLAVHTDYQGQGIGKALQIKVQNALKPRCKLILIAAPAAHAYYQHIGFSNNERCWVLERHQTIKA